MKRLLIPAAFAVIAIAVATGCGGGGGNGSSSSGSSASNGTATVQSQQISGSGNVLVDSKGQALYANDQEKGMVLCNGACTSFWTPLTVNGTPNGSSLSGKLGVIKRPDGANQVTYQGKLLYTFYMDKPGQVAGNGFDDAFSGHQFTWHVVHASGATSSSSNGQSSNGAYGY